MTEKFDVKEHMLVPKHEKLTTEEKKKVLQEYGISNKHLPRILLKDPAIVHLNAKAGDVIKISRISPTSGETVFYRGVVDE